MGQQNENRSEELSASKRALLEQRLRGDFQLADQPDTIPRQPSGEPTCFSVGQERLWYLQQLYPNSVAYNMSLAYALEGPLDATKLASAVATVVQRHEVLRTRVRAEGGIPQPMVGENEEFVLPFEDLSGLATDEQARAVESSQGALFASAFDLTQGLPIRGQLLRLGADRHRLLLAMHHLVADEWSIRVLWEELAAAYAAESRVGDHPLALQYSDFAAWQRSRSDSDALKQQQSYWRSQLEGAPTVLELPTDFPRPRNRSLAGDIQYEALPEKLGSKLRSLAKREKVSLFTLSLAAFSVLLYRYTRRTDLVIGTPISNRSRVELEPLIGFFVNTLAMRIRLDQASSFLDVLQQVSSTVNSAIANQDAPFEELVRELHTERDLSHHPVVQVMFVLQKETAELTLGPGVVARPRFWNNRASKLDLTLFLQDHGPQLRSMIEYSTDLFQPDTIQRMLGHWHVLLESIIRRPSAPIAELQLLSPQEQIELTAHCKAAEADLSDVSPVHHQIEARVRETPHAAAIQFQAAQLTYKQLDERASRVAEHLRSLGVVAGAIVGLCVERSAEMIVGILGILKAGGAYLPLPPDDPAERLRFMVEDAQPQMVLTQQHLAATHDFGSARLLCLDAEMPAPAAQGEVLDVDAAQMAYVIYTSGSTGKPKGVPITHRNLAHSTAARMQYYQESPARFLLLSSFAFDSSVAGIYWTLCHGGELVLPDHGLEHDVQRLAGLVAAAKVTHLLCLPSLYSLLLEYGGARLGSLRKVIVAGEVCPTALVRQHYSLLPGTDLFNEYGPTEGTVWSTVFHIPGSFNKGPVPIGRPISNVSAYVLDEQQNLVPFGVPGELCLSGSGLAAGYLNRPELSAQRFIPNPFTDLPDAKLYRTGDLARYLPDGNLVFEGRIDNQVKIRGHRIELGEVETVLQTHPAIMDAAVIERQSTRISHDADQGDHAIASLARRLSELDNTVVSEMLDSIEKLSEEEAARLLKGEPG